ncbi:hypothetical protein [Calothrix sp. NIES-2100]
MYSSLDPISSRQVEELCLELKEQYTIITPHPILGHQYPVGNRP